MNKADERSLKAVPAWLIILLVASLGAQVLLQTHVGKFAVQKRELPAPPSKNLVSLASLNTPIFAAQVMMLWLQSFDVQPGISLSFRELNYARIEAWLSRILALNPDGQYPLLSAARVYAEVQDPARQRMMLDFVATEFERDPSQRWPWLAHAVYVAKHRLHDIDYALSLSERLAAHQDNTAIPSWARQMQIFVLEDMGELESAKILLGGLLESGQITDSHEQWFLSNRLAELAAQTQQKSIQDNAEQEKSGQDNLDQSTSPKP